MKIYLAGGMTYTKQQKQAVEELKENGYEFEVNLLLSFYEKFNRKTKILLDDYNLIVDSGAFSFFSTGKHLDWDEYITQYIEFINAEDIKLFFELDIDKIIGYDRVKEIRRRLERETGKQPIPVWHKHLGKEEFLRMCDEYDYVAIGGIVSFEIMPVEYKYLPWFIDEAHKRGSKIHGLGFTHSKWLPVCHFDSVDSTAWSTGGRYGKCYTFSGRRMLLHSKERPKWRVLSNEITVYNLKEWLKFSSWAETHL